MREGAGLGRGEEVLNQGTEAVQLGRCRVPTEQDFARIGLEVEREHVFLILDVNLDLVLVFGVRDGEGRDDGHLAAVLGPASYEGTDDARRGRWRGGRVATDGMVEDGEDGLEGGARSGQSCQFKTGIVAWPRHGVAW